MQAFLCISLFFGSVTQAIVLYLPERFRPPLTVVMFLLGVAMGSEASSNNHWSAVFEAASAVVPQVILFVLLPPLLFEAGFGINVHIFYETRVASLLLAFPGVIANISLLSVFAKVRLLVAVAFTTTPVWPRATVTVARATIV